MRREIFSDGRLLTSAGHKEVRSFASQDSLILSDYDKRTIQFHFWRVAEE